MKRLILNLLKFTPIILLLISVNFIADPANIYREGYEAEAASIIVSGLNVAGMKDYNERIFQEQIVLREKECPDTIILGSSRVLELSDEVIKDMNTYRNLGVSGAGLYDFMGILGIFLTNEEMPERVILGLDPWMLNENNGDTRYQALSEYIKIFEEEANITNDRENLDQPYVNNKLQILSPSYFQASLRSLKSDPKKLFDWNDYDFYATSETNIDEGIRYCDGSREYDAEFRNRSLNDVNEAARNYSSGNVYQLEDFNELSKIYCDFLIDMLDYFNENDIEVTFFLPPYHPYVYETLSNSDKYGLIDDVEIYLRALANERNIKVYGSYNPDKVNCKDTDFLDGMHMKRNQIYKAWQVVN